MKLSPLIAGLHALLLGTVLSASAGATEATDLNAGLKTLPLLSSKITGDTAIAIVYDPATPKSRDDADHIQQVIAAGGVSLPDGAKLSVIPISVSELAKLARVRVAFLTPGLEPHFNDISLATSAASILTISTDIDCVRAAKCIVGVATQPSVEIYYSKTAADAAKIEFSQSFVMLVKGL